MLQKFSTEVNKKRRPSQITIENNSDEKIKEKHKTYDFTHLNN